MVAHPQGVMPIVVERFRAKVSPATLFDRIRSGNHGFLFESAGGPEEITTWSFFGFKPFLVLMAHDTHVTLTEGGTVRTFEANPFDVIDELLTKYQVVASMELPPFCGGLAGYIGYDAGRCIEQLPATAQNDLGMPDIYLCAYDAVVAYDHATREVWVLAVPLPGREEESRANAQSLAGLIRSAPTSEVDFAPVAARREITSNFTPDAYQEAVAQAISYVHAGDIFQVNLAQRFTAPLPCGPWELYQRLRKINPAPFAAFLDGAEFQVVSASPERFLQLRPAERIVETRPIKGTRPRGKTPEQDEAMRTALRDSVKDRAELNMIIDLERNDLGRVCQFGSVKVPDIRRIEAYPTVFHTVATVEGVLRPEVSVGELLKATFPGGSITGAPKIRAMEIIEELEGLRRGLYCGAIGYLSFSGGLDLNIVIRTMICRNGQVYFHAGGGIVADSDPVAEYEETLAKARALMDALLGAG